MREFHELCPKCGKTSGDDWSQCDKLCPMPPSPYYDVKLGTVLHDKGVLLHEITEKFWLDFSKLVRDALVKAPEKYRPDLMHQLQDKTSVFGCDLEGKHA